MSRLPPEFVGLWQRVSITLDGRLVQDAGRSWWFQAHERFLDVRAGGGGLRAEMFGGTTTWDGAAKTLSWSHAIDLHDDSSDDSGRIEWVGGDLIEHGTAASADGLIEYTEVWRRFPGDDPVVIADRVGGIGRFAHCGPLAAVFIDDRPGAAAAGGQITTTESSCTFDVSIGRPLRCSPAPAATATGATFQQFESDWTIVESSSP